MNTRNGWIQEDEEKSKRRKGDAKMFSAKIFHGFESMIDSLGTPRQGYVVERIHVSVTAIRCGTELPSLSLHGKEAKTIFWQRASQP